MQLHQPTRREVWRKTDEKGHEGQKRSEEQRGEEEDGKPARAN